MGIEDEGRTNIPQNFSWKTQPLFISSTFSDMMAERDVLRDYVFPELAERLRARRIHLEPIDLRWGVETTDKKEQEEKELLVLKVCLDEIDRCKPFLIGLIGDRYGWVPPEARMKAAEKEKGFTSKIKDKSITALEIEYGVLTDEAQLHRSRFYFREPLAYENMPLEMVKEYCDICNPEFDKNFAEKRLSAYKETIIEKAGKERVYRYKAEWDVTNKKVTGLDDFKKKVLEDIWAELDAQTKELEKTRSQTWQEEEQFFLEEFIEERVIGFSGREDVINNLMEFAHSAPGIDNCGLCVTSESGGGKSALFAKLYKELQKENAFILAHAAGISLRSNSLENMLLIWIDGLAQHLKIDTAEQLKGKSKFDDFVKLFAELISRAAVKSRVIVLVDALNQFERTTHAKYVNWLPELLPLNAKFIFTAIPGEETGNLAKRQGIRVEELKAVTMADAEKIIHAICKRYHKTLNKEVVEVILCKIEKNESYAYRNPLWLNMAVDEFLLLDEDDFAAMKSYKGTPEEKLKQLLVITAKEMPADIEGMYGYLFTKAGARFGKEFIDAVLRYLAVTRYGLRESDLEALINNYTTEKWSNLKFAALRRYLRAHIVRKGEEELWDFRHVQVRASINKSRLGAPEQQKTTHQQIAAYLEKLPREDSLRLNEILWHLFKADDKRKTAEIYGNYWWDREETKKHSKTLKDIILEDERNIKWISDIPVLKDIGEGAKRTINNNFLFTLDGQLKDYIKLEQQRFILLSVLNSTILLSSSNPESADYARDLSVSYNKIGDINTALGDTQSALANYERSLKIRKELHQRNPESADYARDLVVSYYKLNRQKELIEALKYMKRKNMYMDPPLINLCKNFGIEWRFS